MAADKRTRTGRLRIVAGNWRSRLLRIANVPGLRPTSERIRETLFNWLALEISGARCLDLCAGTGALGLEALSRGASYVVFVEKSAVASRTLKSNVVELGAEGAEIHQLDAKRYLRDYRGDKFNIAFLDPPFADDLLGELCRLLADREVLVKDARVYLEMGRDMPPPLLPPGWDVLKDKTAGKVRYMLVGSATVRSENRV